MRLFSFPVLKKRHYAALIIKQPHRLEAVLHSAANYLYFFAKTDMRAK
jgi:hypothetical protein